MAYTFITKQWTISGEHTFNEFTLLNPTLSVKSLQISGDIIYLYLDAVENNGVFKHHVHINHIGSTETDINAIVDTAVAAAFPTATVVA